MNDQQQQQQQHQCVQSKLIPRTFTWRVPRSQIDDMFAASTKTGDKQHHSSAIFELCRSPWKLKIQTGIVDGEQSVGFFLGNEDTVDHDVNYKLVIQQTSKCLQSKIPKDEWWGFPQFMTKTKFVADNSADIKADIVCSVIIYEEEKVNAFPGPKANNRSNFYRSLLLDGEKQETTDLALQPIDGSPILAHKLIIQASSSQFANLINQHTKDGKDVKVKPTISIPFAHDTVQSVMFWIYTGDVKMIEDMAFKNAFELLQMSFLYGLNELAENAVARVLQTLVPQHFIAVHQFAELCCQQYAKKNDALSTNSDVSSGVLLQVAQTLQKGLNQYMNANSQQVMQALLEAAPKQFNSGSCCGPRNESFVKAPIPSAPTAPISASSTVPSTTQGTEKDPVISAPSASSIASTPPPTTQGKEKDPVITFTLSNELAPSVPESKEKVFRYDVTKPMAFVGSMDPKIPEGLRAELMTQLTNLFRSIDFRVSV